MKKYATALSLSLFIAIVSLSIAGDKAETTQSWFDLKNCAFCAPIAAQPGLLEHMKPEYHTISNGLVSVLVIEPGYDGAFKKALEGMTSAYVDMQAGKGMTICPHCSTMGDIEKNPKVKTDFMQTSFGFITIYTSADSLLVAQIQDFGKKTDEASKQMASEMMKAEKK